MKLIMENWRKYLLNESEKGGIDIDTTYASAEMGGIFRGERILRYFQSLNLAVFKMNNIYKDSDSFTEEGNQVGLMNQIFLQNPSSMGYIGSLEDLKSEILNSGPPGSEKVQLGTKDYFEDVKKIHNILDNSGIPIFTPQGPEQFIFLLDSVGNKPISISLADNVGGLKPGFGKFLFSIPAPEPGDVITVSLAEGAGRLPLPSQVRELDQVGRQPSGTAPFARNIIVKRNGNKVNFQAEFGEPV